MKDYKAFETALGYSFHNQELLQTALTHSSYANENQNMESNERLEFLGDSVLGLIVSERLYKLHPEEPEGELSKMKSAIVREESLAEFSKKLQVEKFICLGRGEARSGGNTKHSILADCFEAILGAIYLDSGFAGAEQWLDQVITERTYLAPRHIQEDYKTELQERAQETPGSGVSYHLVDQQGPAHKRIFTVEVKIGGKTAGRGEGSSKKAAEQEAARHALEKLKEK